MGEMRSFLKALKKDVVETLELKSGRGVGYRTQVEELTFDRTPPAL